MYSPDLSPKRRRFNRERRGGEDNVSETEHSRFSDMTLERFNITSRMNNLETEEYGIDILDTY
jgi:hypothetical protein